MKDLANRRKHMVDVQIARRGVRDERVLNAMRTVPRERFIGEAMAEFAYEDSPLPIEEGQTISQPYIVAAMIEAAEIAQGDRVLEVGAGSGYAAAVIGQIAGEVYAIERHEALGCLAQDRFEALGYDNITIRVGDGTKGWPDAGPFDAILVAAGGPEVPQALKEQLAIGGRLVIPVGEYGDQKLCKVTRRSEDRYSEENLGAVTFVPLIGEQGWSEDGRRSASNHVPGTSRKQTLPEMIADAAEALPAFDDPAFGRLFDRFADRRVVLLGDARHTDMGQSRDELNIGQLCREKFGRDAALIGFGTHTGTVAAATDWDGDMEVKRVLPSRRDSYERLCHDAGKERFLLDLSPDQHEALRRRLSEPRLERFIGVIYRPDTELWSHYSQAVLPEQFDAYVWFDETQVVTPLGPEHHRGMPETYPFGE